MKCDTCKYLKKEYYENGKEHVCFCKNIFLPKRYRQRVFYSINENCAGYEGIQKYNNANKLKRTAGPWEVIFSKQWPFRITVENYEGIEIVSYDRCAHNSTQKTIEDCESAVGFKNSEKDDIIKKIEEQKANILLHAAAPEMLAGYIKLCYDFCVPENLETYGREGVLCGEHGWIILLIEKATGLKIEEIL